MKIDQTNGGMRRVAFLPIVALCLFFPVLLFGQEKDVKEEAGSAEIDKEALKIAISNAASIDRGTFNFIAETGSIDPESMFREDGETLTWHMLLVSIQEKEKGKKFFFKLVEPTDPALLAEAFDPGIKGFGRMSAIHPKYIHDLKAESVNGEVKGTFSFKAPNGVYSGGAKFLARPTPDKPDEIYVHTFILEGEGLKLSRKTKKDKWLRSKLELEKK